MAGTPEQIEQICSLLAEGKSLRSIARSIEMAESTLRYWLSSDEDAFAQSARARELGCDALADECLEIADTVGGDPTDKRIRIDTRIRLIGKWSQRYSDKLTVNTKSEVTHRHDLSGYSPDELDALEKLIAKASDATGDTGGESTAVPSKLH